jgi:predicted O-methyltransferase YrrM
MTGGSYSIPEVKALLRVLAAGRHVAEAGTASGDGAAAIAETAASLVTVEVDPERAAAARETLAGLPNVHAFEGDWRDVLPAHAPFGFLFFDAGGIDETALELLEPGGLLLKDDMTPGRSIADDPVRQLLFGHEKLAAIELQLTAQMSVIVAAKRPREV